MNYTLRNETQAQHPPVAALEQTLSPLAASTHLSFKQILFATDFSSTVQLALPYAVEIARRSGATIHAVHVVQADVNVLVPPSEWNKLAQEEQELREIKAKQLEGELQSLPHDFTLAYGKIWSNLSRVIEDKNVDLIVLGTHGRSGIEKVLMGSVAEEILRQAPCPVLTVGPAVSAKATHAAAADLNRILYATDFSPESLAAAPFAVSLAKEYRAELILMHATEKPEPGQVNSAFQTLREIIPLGTWLTLKPRYVVEKGVPHVAILDVAEKCNADLIILGARRPKGPLAATTRVIPSTIHDVVTRAQCPVLTVRG